MKTLDARATRKATSLLLGAMLLLFATQVPAQSDGERLLLDEEHSLCPFPGLAAMCPCFSRSVQSLALRIDASTSVLNLGGSYKAVHGHLETAVQGALDQLPRTMTGSRTVSTFFTLPNEQPCVRSLDPGCGQEKVTRFTKLSHALYGLNVPNSQRTVVIILTDGVEHPPVQHPKRHRGQKKVGCTEYLEKAGEEYGAWLKAHPTAELRFVLVKPAEGQPCKPNVASFCPGESNTDRCSIMSLEENREQLFSQDFWLALAREAIGARQALPREDFSSVVLVGDRRLRCMGLALTQHTILTAKHCLPARRARVIWPEARTLTVELQAVHPTLDVALLRSASPLPVHVLERRRGVDRAPPSGALRFVGFGRDRGGAPIQTAHRSLDLTAAGWGCDGARARETGCVVGAEFILPGSGGIDTCNGDSGGPVFELYSDGVTCGWRAVGIVSRAVDNARMTCGAGGVYTRLDAIDDWILTELGGRSK